MKRSLLLLAMSAIISAASAETIEVTVEAGDSDRRWTPVYVETAITGDVAACVREGDFTYPAQVETLSENQARIWWVIPHLRANQSQTYAIHLGESCAETVFQWEPGPEEYMLDLVVNGDTTIRYMHAPFDPDDVDTTMKPYHHVFSPTTSDLITKGPGGLYSHHRGIYYGYNRISFDENRYDTWHAQQAHQQHAAVIDTFEGPVFGGHKVRINWNDVEGEPFIVEERTIRVFRQQEGQSLIDFESTLYSKRGDIHLGGDRQHAGVQFRAPQEVADNAQSTRYFRPEGWAHLPNEREVNDDNHIDLPWNALQITVQNQRYTVAYLSDAANPKGAAEFSERLYGRFGEFIPHDLSEDEPFHLRYRFWIKSGDQLTRNDVDMRYNDLATPPVVNLN